MEIGFTGDIIFNGPYKNKETDDTFIENDILDFMSSVDTCVCDIEGPIYSGDATKKRVAHKNTASLSLFTDKIHGDVWFIGNNHMLDYGVDGLKETLEEAEKSHIKTLGAGMNIDQASKAVIFGKECGLIGVRYDNMHGRAADDTPGCFIWDEDEIIEKAIKEVKKQCRWCVIVSHGGNYEFCNMPFPKERNRYLKYLEWGADIIVAHHPHVVQNYEVVGEKTIFYSIGNFIFGTDFRDIHRKADIGILLKIRFEGNSYTWDFLPVQNLLESGTIISAPSPRIFQEINSDRYEKLWSHALYDYINHEEKRNIAYNFNRRDISIKARMRIVASHLKKLHRLKKQYAGSIERQMISLDEALERY